MKARTKNILGWLGILLISLLPVFLWFRFGAGISEFTDYGSITHSLGELFALIGITIFAINFVLSARIRFIENIFGGLDKVYIVHGLLGGIALILLLFHPILLVLKFIPQSIAQAMVYLLPSSYWSVNFGIIALLGLVILVYLTLFTKIKYHRWKFTHEFLGLIFILGVLHMFLVRGTASQDLIFAGYYIYAAFVSFIGIGAFSYSLFLKQRILKNAVYKISKISKIKNIIELELIPEHKPIQYQSGQMIFLRFYNERISKETHPFSIASKTNSPIIRIIIKKLGDYTEKLENLKQGDKVSLEGPYGKFHFKNYPEKKQIWIASGIGITPFLGMAEDLLEKTSDVKVDLYYTAHDDSAFIGYELLEGISSKIRGFRFIPWNSSKKGRINVDAIKKISSLFENTKFLICGSQEFKEAIIRNLIKEGVNKNNIQEEEFGFR